MLFTKEMGAAVAQLDEALSYKPAGRRFDPDGVSGFFSLA
jgi:hypothetical protein